MTAGGDSSTVVSLGVVQKVLTVEFYLSNECSISVKMESQTTEPKFRFFYPFIDFLRGEGSKSFDW